MTNHKLPPNIEKVIQSFHRQKSESATGRDISGSSAWKLFSDPLPRRTTPCSVLRHRKDPLPRRTTPCSVPNPMVRSVLFVQVQCLKIALCSFLLVALPFPFSPLQVFTRLGADNSSGDSKTRQKYIANTKKYSLSSLPARPTRIYPTHFACFLGFDLGRLFFVVAKTW